jgi:hypothetical protein
VCRLDYTPCYTDILENVGENSDVNFPSSQETILANILTSTGNKNISADWLLWQVRRHRGQI